MTQKTETNIPQNLNKKLSVQVTLTGLSFLVTDSSGASHFYKKYTFQQKLTAAEILTEIDTVLSSEEQLSIQFQEVTILYTTDIYTVVPKVLFEETRASEYLKFNAKILANDYIAADILVDQEMVVVYVPFVNINNYFFDRYGSFNYYHTVFLLLQEFALVGSNSNETSVFLNIQGHYFDCFIIKKGQVLLVNTYEYNTPEDLLYYVLFNYEQTGISPETTPMILSGEITKNSDLYEILYTYVRNIHFYTAMKLPTIEGALPHEHLGLKQTML